MSKRVLLIDPFIHQRAKLSKEEFLRRIEFLKAIRTRDYELSFYIDSPSKWEKIEHFHFIINNYDFSKQNLTPHIPFAFEVPSLLFKWMNETPLYTIQKQIMFWLSGYYVFNSFREFVPNELLPHIWQEIESIVIKYYPQNSINGFKESDDFDEYKSYLNYHNKCLKDYLKAAKSFIGSPLPEIFSEPSCNPSTLDENYNWGLTDNLTFNYSISYFTDTDWKNIIMNKEIDELLRYESDFEMFNKWKYTYEMFDIRKEGIYSLYNKVEKKLKIREKIPQNIIDQVWQRDLGKCVICGSKEKLEIDHIIPVSRGGANTYRNLQLLCEKHNRSKKNKIG